MKKILMLATAMAFACQISNAQTQKGIQNLGADISYNYSKNNSININPFDNSTISNFTKYSVLNIGPNYSYFIADNLDLGVRAIYSTSSQQNGDNVIPSSTDGRGFAAGIYLRKYFLYGGKIGFRTGINAGYSHTRNVYDNGITYAQYNYISLTNTINGGLNMDLVYYPSKKLGVTAALAALSYSHYKQDNGHIGNGDGSNVNFNFITDGLALSVFYVFGGK